MKKIILGTMMALLFLGCTSKAVEEVAKPKLVVGKSLASMKLNDQFEKAQNLDESTKKVVFAFSKDMAHICNDYFVTQAPDYLNKNNTQFVADVSSAPSLIRSMFILPGLKDFKHTVLLLDNEKVATQYKVNIDAEKIIIVYIENKTIVKIDSINSQSDLKKVIEAQ
jgi:hypothetical protein